MAKGYPSVNRLACYLFQGGDTVFDLDQAAAAQGKHALFDALFLKLDRGSADQDQLAYFIVDFQDFVQARPAFVPGVVAHVASAAFEDLDGPGFLWGESS